MSAVRWFIFLLSAWPLLAQTQLPQPWQLKRKSQEQVTKYLEVEARRLTDRARREMASREAWETVRQERLGEMRDMLGLDPFPARTPLNARVTGIIDRGEYTIEKLAFESLPKVYVTANLYIPKAAEAPLPAVIYVCGHAFSEHGNKTAYQRHPVTLARHGYVALILDSIQIAETFALHHGILNNEMYDWYSRGYTPAGVEVWNVIRALDYLETRPEVDKERFGITGRSGGAAMSWFAGAVEPRLKVIVPIMGNSTYAANVAANTQRLHCDCMFAVNFHRHDLMHQGALIAPRPLLMAHGRRDALFPVPGYQEFEETVAGLYQTYGAAERFENLVVDSGHRDSDYLRIEAVKWFDRWLKRIPEREIDSSVDELPAAELSVFGGAPPADALNYRVHEIFARGAISSSPDGWGERKSELEMLLKEKVFPDSAQVFSKPVFRVEAEEDEVQSLLVESEPGIEIEAVFHGTEEPSRPALLYVASDAEDLRSVRDTLRQVVGRNAVLIVYPRGVGEVPWEKKFWKDTLRNAMHLGRTVDSMRLRDVVAAVGVLSELAPGSPITSAGNGVSGVLALYAAVLRLDVEQVILIDPPESPRGGPIFLNLGRHTRPAEVAALLAPRRLTFYGHIPDAYRWTVAAFEKLGQADKVTLSMSLEASLNNRPGHAFPSGL